jgi:hypothetical protein
MYTNFMAQVQELRSQEAGNNQPEDDFPEDVEGAVDDWYAEK